MTKNVGVTARLVKLLIFFLKTFTVPVTFFPVVSQVKHFRISHLFCARTTPSAGTCLRLDFSLILDRLQAKALNSQWLAICCYSAVPGLSTLQVH